MRVRIRFGKGTKLGHRSRRQQRVAMAIASLLTPAAVVAAILGLWRIAADMALAADFAISSGLFSHWQVWLIGATVLQLGAWMLHRYGARPVTRQGEEPDGDTSTGAA